MGNSRFMGTQERRRVGRATSMAAGVLPGQFQFMFCRAAARRHGVAGITFVARRHADKRQPYIRPLPACGYANCARELTNGRGRGEIAAPRRNVPMTQPRSSRSRYRQFVEDYKHRRLDDESAEKGAET